MCTFYMWDEALSIASHDKQCIITPNTIWLILVSCILRYVLRSVCQQVGRNGTMCNTILAMVELCHFDSRRKELRIFISLWYYSCKTTPISLSDQSLHRRINSHVPWAQSNGHFAWKDVEFNEDVCHENALMSTPSSIVPNIVAFVRLCGRTNQNKLGSVRLEFTDLRIFKFRNLNLSYTAKPCHILSRTMPFTLVQDLASGGNLQL